MIYGYVRVSTKEQHIDRQMKSLIDFGVPEANIYPTGDLLHLLSSKRFSAYISHIW